MADLCFSTTLILHVPPNLYSHLLPLCSVFFFLFLPPSLLCMLHFLLLKLISFLSHRFFITISLLFFPLIYYDNFTPILSQTASTFLLSASSYSNISFPKLTDKSKNVFLLDHETSSFDVVESSEAQVNEPEFEDKYCLEDVDQVVVLSSGFRPRTNLYQVAETTILSLMEENKEMLHSMLEKNVTYPAGSNSDIIDVVAEEKESNLTTGSEAVDINIDYCDNGNEYTKNVTLCVVKSRDDFVEGDVLNGGGYASNFESVNSNLGCYGCMRKEDEWKRTITLFEERYNVVEEDEGYNVVEAEDEGMDLLWETFESDLSKSRRIDDVVDKKEMKKKSTELDYYGNEDEDEDGEEVEEMTNGQLGCLQVYKCCCAGKMNIGKGRSNTVKITKALKRIGWLHHLKRRGNKDRF